MAWVFLSLPCLAEPPAESPSTINISDNDGSFSWQSASFPGNPATSIAFFLLVISFALRAASLAFEASNTFSVIDLASLGFSSKKRLIHSKDIESTTPLTSEETSFALVCEENFGSCIFIEMIAVSPSLASSPEKVTLCFLERFSCSI